MLQQILRLFRDAEGQALSMEAICAQLEISPTMLEHMLRTLVQRGRLVEVDGACDGCTTCPLERICAGIPAPARRGYLLQARD